MRAVQDLPAMPTEHLLTAHAAVRMRQRGISAQLIDVVLTYGRQIEARNHDLRSIKASPRRARHPHRAAHH